MPGGQQLVAFTRILHRTTPDILMQEVRVLGFCAEAPPPAPCRDRDGTKGLQPAGCRAALEMQGAGCPQGVRCRAPAQTRATAFMGACCRRAHVPSGSPWKP